MTRRFEASFAVPGLCLALVLAAPTLAAAQDASSPVEPVEAKLEGDLTKLLGGLRALREVFTHEDSRRDRLIRSLGEKVQGDEKLQGGYYRFQANKRLLKVSDLERGTTQLRRMLRDRPEMARGLTEEDELFQWAVRKFAGEDVPTWIEWKDTSEIADFDAWHRAPDNDTPGLIFVGKMYGGQSRKNGKAMGFEELWLRAAYELHNIQSHREFHELWEKALSGTIDRDEYILGCTRLEYNAWLRTRIFFIEMYHPWAKKRGVKTTANWGLNVPDTFDELIAQYPRGSTYPWRYFGNAYDDATVARELQGTTVAWRKLRRQAGEAWEKLKSQVLRRERARRLWNKITADVLRRRSHHC